MMRIAIVLAVVGAVWFGGTPGEAEGSASGPSNRSFKILQRIEHELTRGVSVKADVRKLLGEADGNGECFLPGQNEPREVWFYEDIQMTDYRQHGDVLLMEMRQQILLVFFDESRFDGFLWTSNALDADGILQATNALSTLKE